jgi:glycosyltransferase involved in cell wall biosynthesis
MPSIAIVIPSHEGARGLDWVLTALESQLRLCDEIVVADDHSRTPLLPPASSKRLRLVPVTTTSRPGNRSAARNAGWRASQAEVIVFLDGDMVPGSGFLDNIRGAYSAAPRAVLKATRFSLSLKEQRLGKEICLRAVQTKDRWAHEPVSVLAYEGGVRPRRDKSKRGEYHSRPFGLPAPPTDRPVEFVVSDEWQFAASNAISVSHDLVSQVGGWDEGYSGWGEEDMDFAYRLHRAGARFLFPDPSRCYAVHLDHPEQPRKRETLAQNASRFVNKFPEVLPLREHAYARYGVRIGAFPTGRT